MRAESESVRALEMRRRSHENAATQTECPQSSLNSWWPEAMYPAACNWLCSHANSLHLSLIDGPRVSAKSLTLDNTIKSSPTIAWGTSLVKAITVSLANVGFREWLCFWPWLFNLGLLRKSDWSW